MYIIVVWTITAYPACGGMEFTCDNWQCVSQDEVCDGKDTCGDMSDEAGCGWYMYILV